MRSTLTLLALLLGSASAAAVETTGGRATDVDMPPDSQANSVNLVIDRAMHWLDGHPASVHAGELMEVVEEIMFFYALHETEGLEAERPQLLREMTGRHRAIEAFIAESGDLQQHLQGDWAALTYPPLAHIITRIGLETVAYRSIIDELVARRHHLTPSRDAMRLWIAIYLERLGYVPESSVQYLLGESPLQQDPQSRALLDYFSDAAAAGRDPQATVQTIYNVTHEIMALTDFGALPPPPVMSLQREHYSRLLDAAIGWATREAALDVLAELVFCSHLLDLDDLPALPAALVFIIDRQQADGSFGITNPDRPNGVRHGVLTSLLALKTLGAQRKVTGK